MSDLMPQNVMPQEGEVRKHPRIARVLSTNPRAGSWPLPRRQLGRRFMILVGVILTASLATAGVVFAVPDVPGVPYYGRALGQGIDTSLVLAPASVSIDVSSQRAYLTGTAGIPAFQTSGRGDGLEVTVTLGILPGVNVDLVNARSYADSNNPGPDTDTEFLVAVNTVLVDTAVLSSTTTSIAIGANPGTSGAGFVDDAVVYGDPLGVTPLLTAGTITDTAWTRTATGPDRVMSDGRARMENVDVMLGATTVVTAAVIQSSASTVCGPSAALTSATANAQFVGLYIAGVNYSSAPPGTVVTVTLGGVAAVRVTIAPVLLATTSGTTADAHAVALRIETLVTLGDVLAGTRIDQAVSRAQCGVGSSSPTAVRLSEESVVAQDWTPDSATIWVSTLAALSLLGLAVYVLRRRAAAV